MKDYFYIVTAGYEEPEILGVFANEPLAKKCRQKFILEDIYSADSILIDPWKVVGYDED